MCVPKLYKKNCDDNNFNKKKNTITFSSDGIVLVSYIENHYHNVYINILHLKRMDKSVFF